MTNVLITGASGDIGTAIARQFSKKGFNLVLTYNKSADKINKLANELASNCLVLIYKCDLSKEKDIIGLKSFIDKQLGPVDILINNAGVNKSGLLQDLSFEDIKDIIETNLIGTIRLTKEIIPYMIHNGYGRIVNISSMWGLSGAANEAVYSASKAGLIAFTKALANEVGKCNITVNCVAPGYIDTSMNKEYTDDDKNNIMAKTPLARLGKPDDVANAVYFLVSNEASFITGQTLLTDGGFLGF